MTCCWLLFVGGCFLHWVAWWKNFPHHVLLHLIAVQCSSRCLLGLSDLQFVHRGFGGLCGCVVWLCLFVGSCCWLLFVGCFVLHVGW